MSDRTRVLIVDDHPMVAEGIQAILETYDDLEVVGTLANGRELIDRVADLDPDVILLDLNMPEVTGLSATEIVLETRPGTRIVILSMHDSPEYISTALSHGARGYILKDVPTDEIRSAIQAVMAGENWATVMLQICTVGRCLFADQFGSNDGQLEIEIDDRHAARSVTATGHWNDGSRSRVRISYEVPGLEPQTELR